MYLDQDVLVVVVVELKNDQSLLPPSNRRLTCLGDKGAKIPKHTESIDMYFDIHELRYRFLMRYEWC